MVLATIKGACGKVRLSAYVLQKALLHHYTKHKLFPAGVYADLPCVQEWALKHAVAIKKLVPSLSLEKNVDGLVWLSFTCKFLCFEKIHSNK